MVANDGLSLVGLCDQDGLAMENASRFLSSSYK